MKTKQLLFSLFSIGLFLGSCSTSQKHVAFSTGGWKEKVDPSSVRINTENVSNENFSKAQNIQENQASTNDATKESIAAVSKNKKVESPLINTVNTEKDNSAETAIKDATVKKEIKKLNLAQRMILKPIQKKAANIVKKAQAVNRSGSSGGSGMSIASLVLGILGLFILGWLFGTLAIIFGAIGMGRDGKGMAIAGLILGIIDLLISVIFILAVLASI